MAHTDPYETDTKLARIDRLLSAFAAEVDETGLPLSPRAEAIQKAFRRVWSERFPDPASTVEPDPVDEAHATEADWAAWYSQDN